MFAPAQLERAWLASIAFEENFGFSLEERHKVSYELDARTEIETLFADEEDPPVTWAIVRVDVDLEWHRAEGREPDQEGGEDEEAPFTLSASVRGAFTWAPDRPPEERFARAWLDYNAMYLLWPYLRGYISTVTGFSTFPPLTIYTMQVPEPPDLESEEQALPSEFENA